MLAEKNLLIADYADFIFATKAQRHEEVLNFEPLVLSWN